ncbi:MAG: hypothetical protein ACLP50_27920 [Solirubrobacteraceae bacterium]
MVGDVPEQVAKVVDGDLGVYSCQDVNGTGCTLMYVDLRSGHAYQGAACNGGSTGNTDSGNTGSGNSGNTGNTGMTTVPGAVASPIPSMNVDPSTWFGYDQATQLALVKRYLAENPSCDLADAGTGPTAEGFSQASIRR